MRKVVHSLRYSVDYYRHDATYLKTVRVFNIFEDWNYLVKTSYNVALSLLGYTENQLPFVNDAAKYLISIGLSDNIIEVSYNGITYQQVKPLSHKQERVICHDL